MLEQGLEAYIETLPDTDKSLYREWERLFNLVNNPAPTDIKIGGIIVPTGYYMDRVAPSVQLYKTLWETQGPLDLIFTGRWSDAAKGEHLGGSAERIIAGLRAKSSLTAEMKDHLVAEPSAGNTSEQAKNTYTLIESGNIHEPFIMSVSADHAPRAYMSFIPQILSHEEQSHTRLYLNPIFHPWNEAPSEGVGTRQERIKGEMNRIHLYQAKGDVATEEQLKYYLTASGIRSFE